MDKIKNEKAAGGVETISAADLDKQGNSSTYQTSLTATNDEPSHTQKFAVVLTNLVKAEYYDISVTFTEDAWFNATEVADRFGKRPVDWIRLDETQAYLKALSEALGISEPKPLIRAKRNSGTWLHPKLAVRFAQWLDIRFAVWCDLQIDMLLKGTHTYYDWKKLRHEAAASHKVMGQILQLTRQRLGKTCKPHHFSNEARMINWALTGVLGKIDRDGLSSGDLDLLAKLENFDTVLIGCEVLYIDRKKELEQFASDQRNKLTTGGLQSTVFPCLKVGPSYVLGIPDGEFATSPDVLAGS
jgi:hypothetical protein